MIGERELLPDGVIRSVERVEEAHRHFRKALLELCSGLRRTKGVVDVVRSLATRVENDTISADEIDEDCFTSFSTTNNALAER